jgi:DNA mismatch endonuclease (patch repair protein)
MADTLSPAARSQRMAAVRGKDTKPELRVRKLVHALGYRFRLHRADIPGRPDLVFPSRRRVIFVHGCFWHRHPDENCPLARLPKSRLDFWLPKLDGNRRRDLSVLAQLGEQGWRSLTLWECELTDMVRVGAKVRAFLGPTPRGANGHPDVA